MSAYLILRHLRVQHANAMTSWNVVGAPAVTAHLGFAGAIAHRFGLELEGVAIVHHSVDHEGRYSYGTLQPNRVRGVPFPSHPANQDPSDRKMALSDQPFALAHYAVSLLIRLSGETLDTLAEHAADGRLTSWLMANARFAGGTIVRIADLGLSHRLDEAVLQLPRSGFWVLDASDRIAARGAGQDQLDAAIAALYPLSNEPAAASPDGTDGESGKPWLAMSLVGYKLLEAPTTRAGVRQDLPHAFCEPLLGLIEYRSMRLFTGSEPPFWAMAQEIPDVVVARAA